MQVVIVGGSLVGLATGLAIAKHGLNVTILERASGQRVGGAGLGIDLALLRQASGSDPGAADAHGPRLTFLHGSRDTASWQAIYDWLRHRVQAADRISLIEDCPVDAVGENDRAAWTACANGTVHQADIVVGADGYRSLVRGVVEPDGEGPRYAGYIGWRGLVSERVFLAPKQISGNEAGFGDITPAGYRLIAYPVPGPDGSIVPGERQITFAWYDTEHDDLLNELGCLQSGLVIQGLSPDRIPATVKQRLFRRAHDIWPSPWREAVLACIASDGMFATPIAECMPQHLVRGRFALVGDAAHVSSPMTGSGLAYGLRDAACLATAIAAHADPLRALQAFEHGRLAPSQALVAYSRASSAGYLKRVPGFRSRADQNPVAAHGPE